MIADRETDAPLGVVGPYFPEGWPEPEIAWTVFEQAEGRGIAFEAAQEARRFAYETLGWTTAISCTMPENTRSQALAQRMGCVRDGTYGHPEGYTLHIWRHPAPEALR
jgi:ribosomal-protein-alanine N-acetyltransferase